MDPICLIHIAPELPPKVGGVADYTAILSRRLVEVSDGAVEPVLVHAGGQQADAIEVEVPMVDLSGEQSARRLAEVVQDLAHEAEEDAVVLLEYSGYGYAKRGAPWWVARGLQRVCGGEEIPLITTFHEISASGSVWSSAFWLSPVQSWIARRIGRLSSALMSTHPMGVQTVEACVGNETPVRVSPAFSNVGEPSTNPPWDDRDCVVLFGGRDEKEELYTRTDQLTSLFDRQEIDRIVDLGPPPDAVPSFDLPHDILGIQPADTISQWLGRARLGLAHRRLDIMTKSGLVAAYLAHGVPLIVVPHGPATRSPVLEEGDHYLTLDRARAGPVDGRRMSQLGYEWYQRDVHSLGQARSMCQTIRSSCMSSSAC